MESDTPFQLLRIVKGSIGGHRVELGAKGICRYCGETDQRRFRKVAHTIPESLGNKWIVSQDECDACNERFSIYDDAVAKAVSPLLTVGGTRGKANKIRQTGRSAGGTTIRTGRTSDGRRSLSFSGSVPDLNGVASVDPDSRFVRLVMPVAGVPFVPRLAYKAIVKSGLGILPEDELQHFQRLLRWIGDPHDCEEFARLNVGLSFGSVGNAPPIVAAALMRRTSDNPAVPYMLFFLCVGSVCFQIDLKSDAFDGPWPPIGPRSLAIRWTNTVTDEFGRNPIIIEYGESAQLDWSSSQSQPQPVERLITVVDLATSQASITPQLRQQSL